MNMLSDNNMATLIPPWAQAVPSYAYAAAPTHCFLCVYDALYDYDLSGCFRGRTSSTSVTTMLSGASDLTANEACFPDPAGGHEWNFSDSGVSCDGYRYYKPDAGRWVNRDPLGDHASDAARQLHGQLAFVMAVTAAQWLHVAVDEYNDPIHTLIAACPSKHFGRSVAHVQTCTKAA